MSALTLNPSKQAVFNETVAAHKDPASAGEAAKATLHELVDDVALSEPAFQELFTDAVARSSLSPKEQNAILEAAGYKPSNPVGANMQDGLRAHQTVKDMLEFIDKSPSPHHATAEVAARLESLGFSKLDPGEAWDNLEPGKGYYLEDNGTLVGFRMGTKPLAEAGVRMIGAHTDSPTFRIKSNADVKSKGYEQVGAEVYGGPLFHTWQDRDLGLAGKIYVKGPDGEPQERLLHVDRPILRIPSLAIHLDRGVNSEGLKLNPQEHLTPVFGLQSAGGDDGMDHEVFREFLSESMGLAPEEVLSWDLTLVDTQPSEIGGLRGEFVFAPRLDNLAMTHAATEALMRSFGEEPTEATQMIALYNHEEVGSRSGAGAAGPMVDSILDRLAEVEGPGAVRGGKYRAVEKSVQLSADMAHAVHPSHASKHEPNHAPVIGGGPVLKISSSGSYATSAEGEALFETIAQGAGVPTQKFVNRNDSRGGSTIGPISSARFGIETIDIGNPMLSMHSAREQAGTKDPEYMVKLMEYFLRSA